MPLSAREGDRRFEVLYQGVPDWIRDDLISWLEARLRNTVDHYTTAFGDEGVDEEDVIRNIGRELRINLGDEVVIALDTAEERDAVLLDLIDYCLAHELRQPYDEGSVDRLEDFLKHGCVWTPILTGPERWTLVRRVDQTAIKAAEETIRAASETSGAHLAAAWTCAYGRQPNPVTAYEQAVKAVEAVAVPLFAPNDPKATLGKAIANVRDKPGGYTVVLPSGDPVGQFVAMMQMLWQGHPRHANPERVVDANEEQAKAAVHIATTLVQLLSSGAVTGYP
jgi:hypothetical protein